MGILNLIKNHKPMVPIKKDDLSVARDAVQRVIDTTNEQIQTGLSKDKASNGTPMETLNGAAKYAATAKNIGRETKPDGGMLDGYNTIAKNNAAKAMKAGLEMKETTKKHKKVKSHVGKYLDFFGNKLD